MGLAFSGAGLGVWRMYSVPRVFDRQAGYYWRSRRSPQSLLPAEVDALEKTYTRLDQVHAIQLIRWRLSSSNNGGGITRRSRQRISESRWCHEINLVLRDARRVHVVAKGGREQIIEDARRLGEFLGVPVWQEW